MKENGKPLNQFEDCPKCGMESRMRKEQVWIRENRKVHAYYRCHVCNHEFDTIETLTQLYQSCK